MPSTRIPVPRRVLPVALCLPSLLILAGFGPAEAARQRRAPLDKALQVGTRVTIKGALAPGRTLRADEIEIEHGDDDDEELRGRIQSIDTEKESFTLLGVTIRVRDEAKFELEPGRPATFADLAVGQRVKVDGRQEPDGRFATKDIRIRENQDYDEVRIVGPIEEIDFDDRGQTWLVVVGFTVYIDGATELTDELSPRERPALLRRPGGIDDEDDLVFAGGRRKRLQLAGEVRLRGEYLENLNLDPANDEDELVPEITGRLGAVYNLGNVQLYGELAGVKEFIVDHPDPFEDGNSEVRVAELWVQFRGVGVPWLSIVIGRQKFDEEREWYYNRKDLDAVRFLGTFRRVSFEASLSSSIFDNSRNQRDQDKTNLILQSAFQATRDLEIQGYWIQRTDDNVEEETAQLLGFRLLGEHSRWLEYWVDVAHDSGRRATFAADDNTWVSRDVDASAMDLGAVFRPRIRFDPTFVIGWAHGDGGGFPESGDNEIEDLEGTTDGTFHQSGLQRNRWKYNGLVSFRYYGEVMDPELSNIDILTLGLGLRPIRSVSTDLLYHRYRQDVAAGFGDVGDIDDRPSGINTDLGDEIDLVFGYEPSRRLELRLTAGLFRPGSAYAGDATDAKVVRFQTKFRF